MKNEIELIEKAKARDAQAISILYENNIKIIYRFVLYKTNHRELAEDITSEVFVRAFEKIEQFKGNSSFKTWLYIIAKNLIIEWYRNKDKTTELIYEPEGTETLEEEIEIEDVGNNHGCSKNESVFADPSSQKLRRTMATADKNEQLLNKILSQLDNENYRQVLELRFLLNYTIKETAEELKLSEGNVKVIQNRALKKAREIIMNR